MSKLLLLITFLGLTLFNFFQPPTTFAQAIGAGPNPRAQTIPDPLRVPAGGSADFIVDVGDNAPAGVTGWKMRWECGPAGPIDRRDIKDATLEPGGRNIRGHLDNSGTATDRCEFDSKNN